MVMMGGDLPPISMSVMLCTASLFFFSLSLSRVVFNRGLALYLIKLVSAYENSDEAIEFALLGALSNCH